MRVKDIVLKLNDYQFVKIEREYRAFFYGDENESWTVEIPDGVSNLTEYAADRNMLNDDGTYEVVTRSEVLYLGRADAAPIKCMDRRVTSVDAFIQRPDKIKNWHRIAEMSKAGIRIVC